jgi:polyhydroxyalkanoate synthesis regulator phasin
MKQTERKDGIGARLRRAWNTALRAAEVMSVSPMEDLNARVDRLERELATMKKDATSRAA